MANVNAPFGFRPVRRSDSADWSTAFETRQIASNYATGIGMGDAVKAISTGFLERATAADNALADPGIYGIFIGCEYYDTALAKKVFLPRWTGATTALAGSVLARVISDPRVVFEVQMGGSTTLGGVIADLGANIGILDGAVNTITGMSTQGVDQTSLQVTVTLPFRVVNLSQKIGNDNASPYNTVEVVLNNSAYNSRLGF